MEVDVMVRVTTTDRLLVDIHHCPTLAVDLNRSVTYQVEGVAAIQGYPNNQKELAISGGIENTRPQIATRQHVHM